MRTTCWNIKTSQVKSPITTSGKRETQIDELKKCCYSFWGITNFHAGRTQCCEAIHEKSDVAITCSSRLQTQALHIFTQREKTFGMLEPNAGSYNHHEWYSLSQRHYVYNTGHYAFLFQTRRTLYNLSTLSWKTIFANLLRHYTMLRHLFLKTKTNDMAALY